MRFRQAPTPRLFGHRGASGRFPENTLTSFRAAIAERATHLELDVHMSADGQVFVLHDGLLDRTTDATGEARQLTWAELSKLDAGCKGPREPRARERIPRLAEVLEAFPEVPLNIEVKQAEPPMIEAFFAVLDAHGARDRVLVAAENHDIMLAIRAFAPDATTGFSSREVFGFVLEGSNPDYRPPGFALQVPEMFDGMPIVTPAFIERAKKLAVEVHVWTVNDPADARRLLDLGVDGIMSDVPGDIAPVMSP
jgi:glycerophosphoryl diester phosphodiesterase